MARSFNGANFDRILLSSGFTLSSATMTISVWVFPTSLSVAPGVFCSETNLQGYELQLNSTGTIELDVTGNVALATSTGTISTGVWTHIAASYDSTQGKVYINGIGSASSTSGGAPSGSPQYILGVYGPTTSHAYTGYMADVAAWNTVLSSNAIMQLAAGYRPHQIGSTANLTGWWPLGGY